MMQQRSCRACRKCSVMAPQCTWRHRPAPNRRRGPDFSPSRDMSLLTARTADTVVPLFAFVLALAPVAHAQQGNLTVERIFSGEFRGQGVGPSRWLDDSTYTVVAPASRG